MMIAAILLFMALFLHFLPAWTRPDLFFAVTVGPDFRRTAEARSITRLYRLVIWASMLTAIALIGITRREQFMLLSIAGYYCATAVAHRRALAHSVPGDSAVEVNLAAPRESLPGGPVAMLVPLAALGVLAAWASRNWDRLPERLAVHWGLQGPDRWIARTPHGVYGIIAQDAVLSLVLILIGAGIFYWSRRLSAAGASAAGSVAAEQSRFRRLNVQILFVLASLPAAYGWIIVLQPPAPGAWLAGTVLVVAGCYYAFLIRNRPRFTAQASDSTPNSCWKLGIFYFNPADPAVFVLQRFGIGYTFNFASRWSWAGFAMLLAAVSLRAGLR
jgi:uncharacterized membrane protein